MNKEFALIVWKRFLKGFMTSLGAFLIMYIATVIPVLNEQLKDIVTDPLFFVLASSFLLALEKYLQGYRPQ